MGKGVCKCARVEYCNVVMRTVYSSMISLPYYVLKKMYQKNIVVIFMRNLAQTKMSFNTSIYTVQLGQNDLKKGFD